MFMMSVQNGSKSRERGELEFDRQTEYLYHLQSYFSSRPEVHIHIITAVNSELSKKGGHSCLWRGVNPLFCCGRQ